MDHYFTANAVLSLFSKNYMELKKGLPVRPSEMGVLNILAATEGPHTSVMLARMLGVSKPMITAHIASLQNKGYVTKVPSPRDRRVCHIYPTDQALELVACTREDTDRQLDRLIAGMGQENFDTFLRLAEQANHILMDKGE